MPRQSLGRGLSALLGDEKPVETVAAEQEVDIDLIEPNPDQPRVRFTDEGLDELAQSISTNGVIQPIVLRAVGGRYQIVAGERRWRASQRAGLRKMPAVVREVSDEKLLELALIENIQRQELNPIEEASAYRKLIDTLGLTQESVSERVGKDRTVIATAMRLLKLPEEVKKHIEEGRLSAGHGRALLMNEDATAQKDLAKRAVESGWSVRELERAAKSRRGSNVGNKGVKRTADANEKAAATKLMRHLNTNVKIIPGKKGGKIEIEYYGNDDLDRLYQLILSK